MQVWIYCLVCKLTMEIEAGKLIYPANPCRRIFQAQLFDLSVSLVPRVLIFELC